ncbi:MAG: TIR domain-containing protein [Sphingomonadaceae bacterium]
MADVFLSYSRIDQARARAFADGFAAAGLDVWWDTAIKTGEVYDEVTEAVLRSAGAVVVLWSANSVGSRWVRAEAIAGQRRGRLVPVMLEPCERPVMFELVQTADLSGWGGDPAEPVFRALVADVARMADRPLSLSEAGPDPGPARSAAPASAGPSIALLPLADMGGQSDDGFADGMVEEISSALSRFPRIKVIAGQSSLAYRGSSKPPAEIARELGVRYLLEGSVRRAGGRIRVAVRLVEAETGHQIWSERFDETMDDVFDLQDRVALAAVGAIDSAITDAEIRRVSSRPAVDAGAYELTVRAWGLLARYTEDSIAEARALAGRAQALEPDFGWALSVAGFARAAAAANGWSRDVAADAAEARRLAERAAHLAGDDPQVLAIVVGTLLNVGGDLDLADRLIERALGFTPSNPYVLFWAAWVDLLKDRPERALGRLEQSMQLNPRSHMRAHHQIALGRALFFLGRHAEAATVNGEALALVPDFPGGLALYTASLALAGREADARIAWARLQQRGGLEQGLQLVPAEAQRARIRAALAPIEQAELAGQQG